MATITERIANVKRQLDWLQREDGARTVFGASQHEYRTDSPAADELLAAFEADHDLTLPESYRAFLGSVTNGGGGPYYGLSPLEPLEVHDGTCTIARPFPLTAEWSPKDGSPPIEDGASPHDGCVHLADQGCGYFDFIVVRGPAAGQVWSDYTAGDGSIAKSYDDFLDWYEAWLEQAQIEWLDKNAIGMALWAPRHYPGIDDAVALLEKGIERSPKWATGRRTLGYVRLNREQFDGALAMFEEAAELGKDEPQARLQLDRARVARFQGDPEGALTNLDQGLAQASVWAATKDELLKERLGALDHLERPDDALATLQDMVEDTFFHLDYHFDLAYRRLRREEPDLAWAALDHAVTENIGPNRHNDKATKDSVYGQFADWLAECEEPALAQLVRAR
jgi:hypothetical protein